MSLRSLVILIFITPISFTISAQYLDPDFGVNGTVQIDMTEEFANVNLEADSLGRLYLDLSIRDSILFQNASWSHLTRIKSNGKIDLAFGNQGTFSYQRDSFNTVRDYEQFYKGNKIFERTEDADSVYLVMRDLDLNQLATYHSSAELGLANGFNVVTLEDNSLLLTDFETIYKYDSTGELNISFGTGVNGINNIENNLPDDLVTQVNFYNMAKSANSDDIYVSGYALDSLGAYQSWISKFSSQTGQLDSSFGNNGLSEVSTNLLLYFAYFIHPDLNGGIYFSTFQQFDSLTQLYYTTSKIDTDGNFDFDFGGTGYYNPADPDDADFFYPEIKYHLLLGSNWDNKLIHNSFFYKLNLDSTYYLTQAYLSLNDENGAIDSSFANNGYFKLDFLPGEQVYQVKMTQAGEIFVLSIDSILNTQKIYVSKLDMREIFGEEKVDEVPAHNFSIYPNPTSGDIYFDYEGVLQGDIEFFLYDMQGHFVGEKFLARGAFVGFSNRIALGDLADGVYILKCISNNRETLFTEKFVVSK